MIGNDLFITVVVMFLLVILAVALLLITLIFVAINSGKQKKFVISPVQIVVSLVSLIILYLWLPFGFLSLSQNKEGVEAEKLYKLAVKTALIPSVKSEMLQFLGSYYAAVYNGKEAVKAFEQSFKINENKVAVAQLCNLYTIKGDYEEAIGMCKKLNLQQIIAVNYILQNDYKNAYEVINKKIQNGENITHWDYATRAYINRKINKKDLFEKDYQKALESCPNNALLKKLYENENYYDDLYLQYKKQYSF